MTTDSLLILGTGALGTLFAARLAAAGVEVTMLGAWPEGLAALQKHGARLAGQSAGAPVRATDRPEDCRGATQALVLVKAWKTERAAELLAGCLSPGGLALTLQNGLGNRESLVARLGERRVALGVTTVGASLLEPGVALPGGNGTITLESHPQLGPLEGMLRGAGFEVQTVEDAAGLVWGKLVVNAAINPLTALLRLPNGELLKRPGARALMDALANETAAVAGKLGVKLPFPDPCQAAEVVARRTAKNRSSMLQDVLRGVPTEIEAINGAVVRLGEQVGIATPVNRVVCGLIRSLAD
jgi:2-dehydropantoate 2-reductase